MKRRILSNLALGFWLMLSPFVLVSLNRGVLTVLWEDLLLGFGIATFSLCRLYSRRSQEVAIADWFITGLGLLTLINPFLYSYYSVKIAAWNNVTVGAVVFLMAIFQDLKDAGLCGWHHRRSHS